MWVQQICNKWASEYVYADDMFIMAAKQEDKNMEHNTD